jgi:hypothetical protein
MRVRGCPECERLWEDYTDATFAFVQIDSRTEMARFWQESPEVMALLREGVEAAAQRRDAALEGLKRHETARQTRSAAAP